MCGAFPFIRPLLTLGYIRFASLSIHGGEFSEFLARFTPCVKGGRELVAGERSPLLADWVSLILYPGAFLTPG